MKLNETLSLNREVQVLGAESLKGMAFKLAQLIEKDYGYKMSCDSAWFSGLNEASCVKGLRTLARAFYREKIPKSKLPPGLLNLVIVAPGSEQRTTYDDKSLTVQLPASWNDSQAAAIVNAVLVGQALRKREFILHQFNVEFGSLNANISKAVEFESQLSWAERWLALNRLVALAKSNLALFDGPGDGILITAKNLGVSEAKLTTQVELSLTSSLENWKKQLELKDDAPGATRMRIYKIYQAQIAKLKLQFAEVQKLNVACSTFAKLSLNDCFAGLTQLTDLLKSSQEIRLPVGSILIVGDGEISGPCQLIPDPHLLAIRYDITDTQLYDYLKERGWNKLIRLDGKPQN